MGYGWLGASPFPDKFFQVLLLLQFGQGGREEAESIVIT
ncbi:Hypothetical protein BN2458_PEG0590 [Helicobacter typhlonius]|uniref:Uncharacterized protein n=1 Tax=Helicobacter typhlonius TaxID=76936 RepID=A0A0S4PVP2_9HELI|nr:Hypothetical protein BN2458_PEG0590 [Helicobacter typhlonius]